MTRMPPQAYTKEVLASAFDWLSRQNESVKKSIRNSDDLVGLYLKSTRLTKEQQAGSTASAGYSADLSSAKSFRSELQGLALNLKQFEDKPVQDVKSEPMSDYLHELNLMMSSQAGLSAEPSSTQNVPIQHSSTQSPQRFVTQSSAPSQAENPPANSKEAMSVSSLPSESAETVLLKLDKKTITAINLAKERLNLSSNTEAIRVLVSLGEKHLKKLFGAEE